jgi:hypothetical protein
MAPLTPYPASRPSVAQTTITLDNESDRPLLIWWLDITGTPFPVGRDGKPNRIPPGRNEVTIRKSCGARPAIYGLTCTLTFSNHTVSEYLRNESLNSYNGHFFLIQTLGERNVGIAEARESPSIIKISQAALNTALHNPDYAAPLRRRSVLGSAFQKLERVLGSHEDRTKSRLPKGPGL